MAPPVSIISSSLNDDNASYNDCKLCGGFIQKLTRKMKGIECE